MPRKARKARGGVAAKNDGVGKTRLKERSVESECSSQSRDLSLEDLKYHLKDFDIHGMYMIFYKKGK